MSDTPTPVILSWSGGKDAMMALEALEADPAWEVVGLLCSVNDDHGRITMHGVLERWLEEQVAALDLPLTTVRLSAHPCNDEYERVMSEAMVAFKARGVRHVAFGDLFLQDIRDYRTAQLELLGMEAVFPIWARDTGALAEDFIRRGHRAILTCVDGEQLDGGFAGRSFDADLLASLPADADPCGEHGEFHTFVYDGPRLARPIPVRPGRVVLRDDRFHYCELEPA